MACVAHARTSGVPKSFDQATVSAILPDAPWNLGESISVRPSEMPILGKSQRKQSRGIGKRAAVEVMAQFAAPTGLTFLSTAEGGMNSFQ